MKILTNKKLAWLGALVLAFTFIFSALIMPIAANRTVHADAKNLSGTTWLLKDNLGATFPNKDFGNWNFSNDTCTDSQYAINFTSNSQNFNEISFYDSDADDTSPGNCNVCYGNVGVWKYYNNSWSNNNYKTIQIVDGADAGDGDLIAWFEANATLTAGSLTPAPTPATGVIEDTIAIALFAVVVAGATTVVVLNKKKNNI